MGGKVFLPKQKRLVTHQKRVKIPFLFGFSSLLWWVAFYFALQNKTPPILRHLSQPFYAKNIHAIALTENAFLFHPIIRRFFGNLHIVHMRFANTRTGNFHEFGFLMHFVNVFATQIKKESSPFFDGLQGAFALAKHLFTHPTQAAPCFYYSCNCPTTTPFWKMITHYKRYRA